MNLTRILVTGFVVVSEVFINALAATHIANSTDFIALMIQDIAVIPTASYFMAKIDATGSSVNLSTGKAAAQPDISTTVKSNPVPTTVKVN